MPITITSGMVIKERPSSIMTVPTTITIWRLAITTNNQMSGSTMMISMWSLRKSILSTLTTPPTP